MIKIRERDALLVVDATKAFMKGGGLPVPDGEGILPPILNIMPKFARTRRFAIIDRHEKGAVHLASSYVGRQPFEKLSPSDGKWQNLASCAKFNRDDLRRHLEMVKEQILWPDHAIKGSGEDELCPPFTSGMFAATVYKGEDPTRDSLSGFFDSARERTELTSLIREWGLNRCFVVGLALDFCVGETALDAVLEGFETYIVRDATRSVRQNGSYDRMVKRLNAANVRVVNSIDLW